MISCNVIKNLKQSLEMLIKIVLKRRKECGTYLATAHRHRWRLKMTVKNDRSNVAFSNALQPSSGVEEEMLSET